ncbi:asparagine synthase (glutamine-hydrolysing) [Caldanaerobius fijiensis DSM 17918]|uniref:asparagine synthase (glutamine-hydrolyzing) n=1 Tax=Caldanaerobius fijiensis DSM 17918 TaxID=1121256 RepID=A0A1M5ASC7_9THEO|nr:asparagine synthase (glutamine-hydrolyzing) [Caldanaerobius fijiensis]SHF33115.1 asparagine synthase (glutamine-hydrolysing) [Caldanaerobius fijiensis DSM 17918]
MCGIAGWVDYEQNLSDKRTILEKMGETLANRGPDESGIFLSPHAAFAHRRLIVVDPAGGKQPMTRRYNNADYTIVYNGELYNTNDLRQQLECRGYTFHSRSDTEVLLISYIEWGTMCVNKFNGIFAFAIWDDRKKILFAARDRVGVKPFFFTVRKNSFIFGSEIKALLAHPLVKPQVDAIGLAEIFAMGPTRTPGLGVFKDIYELKPGYWLIFDQKGVHQNQYWRLESKPHTDDIETTAEKVRWLLKNSVERQLVADVPVCTFLSGGLDSSALTAIAQNVLKNAGMENIHTYSVDYVDNDLYFKANEFQPNSDNHWIEIMSKYLNTQHHNIIIDTQQLVESLKTVVVARDLPGMADIDSSLYLFCREIKKGATVALSGECADEIFGGYPWFRNPEVVALNTFPWIRKLKERSALLSPELVKILHPMEYVYMRYKEALKEVPHMEGENPHEYRMRELLYVNMTRFMSMLLDRKDRMSMAVGLEVRVPYADHRIVEYAWNIPWDMKTCDNMEKGILRRALKGLLPDQVLYRKKSPYPKTHHPAYLKATKNLVTQILEDPTSPILPLINPEKIRELIDTDASEYTPAWFSQLMGSAQLFAYLYQINTWLAEYHVEIIL